MLACARCKSAWYCSKACQRADWKAGHKAMCFAPKAGLDHKSADNLIFNAVERNYYHVRRLVQDALEAPNVAALGDIVVQLDLTPQPFPDIRVTPLAAYLDRSKTPDDWFFPGTPVFEENQTMFLETLKSVHAKLIPDQLLLAVAHSGGFSVQRLTFTHPDMGNLFSRDALDDDSDLGKDIVAKSDAGDLREVIQRAREAAERLNLGDDPAGWSASPLVAPLVAAPVVARAR